MSETKHRILALVALQNAAAEVRHHLRHGDGALTSLLSSIDDRVADALNQDLPEEDFDFEEEDDA